MDRRQQKTRAAIFGAFCALLTEKSYHRITVQEIIDRANVGRATFYAHFETKDDLLKELCEELFGHIVESAKDAVHTPGLYSNASAPQSVFCHLLQHLQKNDGNILGLLSGESSEIFLRYFRESLRGLVHGQVTGKGPKAAGLPEDFVENHVIGSFVEMVLWWIKGGRKYSPEELDRCFLAVIAPVL